MITAKSHDDNDIHKRERKSRFFSITLILYNVHDHAKGSPTAFQPFCVNFRKVNNILRNYTLSTQIREERRKKIFNEFQNLFLHFRRCELR